MLSCALREVRFECAAQLRPDRHAARVAAFSFEEAGWESEVAADLAVVQHVADRKGEDFGDAEAEEHLRSDEGAIARIQPADVSEENSLFARGEWT